MFLQKQSSVDIDLTEMPPLWEWAKDKDNLKPLFELYLDFEKKIYAFPLSTEAESSIRFEVKDSNWPAWGFFSFVRGF